MVKPPNVQMRGTEGVHRAAVHVERFVVVLLTV